MKEILKNMIDNPREVLASATFLGLVVFGYLAYRASDSITPAKDFMTKFAADPSGTLCEGYPEQGCEYVTPKMFCDGNGTILDMKDDVCEVIPYYDVPLSR